MNMGSMQIMAMVSFGGLYAADSASYYSMWDIAHRSLQQDDNFLKSRNLGREDAIATYLRSFNTFTTAEIDAQLKNIRPISNQEVNASYELVENVVRELKQVVTALPENLDKNVEREVCLREYLQLVGVVRATDHQVLQALYPNPMRIAALEERNNAVVSWIDTAPVGQLRKAYHAEHKGDLKFLDFIGGFAERAKRATTLLVAGAYLGLLDKPLMAMDSAECHSLSAPAVRIGLDCFKGAVWVPQEINFTLNLPADALRQRPAND